MRFQRYALTHLFHKSIVTLNLSDSDNLGTAKHVPRVQPDTFFHYHLRGFITHAPIDAVPTIMLYCPSAFNSTYPPPRRLITINRVRSRQTNGSGPFLTLTSLRAITVRATCGHRHRCDATHLFCPSHGRLRYANGLRNDCNQSRRFRRWSVVSTPILEALLSAAHVI